MKSLFFVFSLLMGIVGCQKNEKDKEEKNETMDLSEDDILERLNTILYVKACSTLDSAGQCPLDDNSESIDISSGKLYVTVYPNPEGSKVLFKIQLSPQDPTEGNVAHLKSQSYAMESTSSPITHKFQLVPGTVRNQAYYNVFATIDGSDSVKGPTVLLVNPQ